MDVFSKFKLKQSNFSAEFDDIVNNLNKLLSETG